MGAGRRRRRGGRMTTNTQETKCQAASSYASLVWSPTVERPLPEATGGSLYTPILHLPPSHPTQRTPPLLLLSLHHLLEHPPNSSPSHPVTRCCFCKHELPGSSRSVPTAACKRVPSARPGLPAAARGGVPRAGLRRAAAGRLPHEGRSSVPSAGTCGDQGQG